MTVRVEIRLHAGLLRFAPEPSSRGTYLREYANGARVSDVLASFGFAADRQIIIGLDGEAARTDAVLHDGAQIDLVPPIAGGR